MYKHLALLLVFAAIFWTSTSCTVSKAVHSSLPMERRTECESACHKLQLEFAAMVLMMDHAGCVCQVPATAGGASEKGGGLGAGASTISAAQAAQAAAQAALIAQQQQQQQQRRQRQY